MSAHELPQMTNGQNDGFLNFRHHLPLKPNTFDLITFASALEIDSELSTVCAGLLIRVLRVSPAAFTGSGNACASKTNAKTKNSSGLIISKAIQDMTHRAVQTSSTQSSPESCPGQCSGEGVRSSALSHICSRDGRQSHRKWCMPPEL